MSGRMLYKYPGPHEIHGDRFDYIIVDDEDEAVEAAISEGWFLTTDEAKGVQIETSVAEKPVKPTKSKDKGPTNAGWGSKSDDVNI